MRRALTATLILLALAVPVSIAGYWHLTAQQFLDGLERWRQAHQNRGYQVDYVAPEVTGFPLGFETLIAQPRVAAPKAANAGGWQWQGPDVAGEAELLSPLEIALAFPGQHSFTFEQNGTAHRGTARAEAATGLLRLRTDGRPGVLDVQIENLAVAAEQGPEVRADRLTSQIDAGFLAPFSSPETAPRAAVKVAANRIVLPEGARTLLGSVIQEISANTEVVGSMPSGPVKPSLAAWRDSQGFLDVQNTRVFWGDLKAEANGELRLDGAFRPAGQLMVRFAGLARLLDRIAQAGLLEPQAAATLKVALALMPQRRLTDGQQAVELPVTLEAGQLFLGPVPILRLRPLL